MDLVAALDGIEIKEAARKLATDFHITPAQASLAVARATTSQVARYKELQRQSPDVDLPECKPLEEGFRGLNRKTIEHWGLARSENGVLIPLLNAKGRLCSYTVRRDDGKPKYENAAGVSKCYPFGLHENAGDVVKEGFAWIVEGQFDAITLWQKGYRNVVALMGSSMTEQQAMLLLSVTSTLVLVMDGDKAGRDASAKIRKQWGSAFEISEFVLPDGLDPDQYEGVLER